MGTFKFSDPAFATLETAIKSVSSNKKDSAHRKLKVNVGGSANVLLKKSNARHYLDTIFGESSECTEIKPVSLCAEIEYNFSTAIAALGESVWDVESPTWNKSKETQFVVDEHGCKKRLRRRPEELQGEKTHVCPYADCHKSYTSRCSLHLHIKRNHQECESLKDREVAPVRINSKVKKGVNVYKVFKPAQAQKFDCGATNRSTTIDESESQNAEIKTKTSFSIFDEITKIEAQNAKKSECTHNLVQKQTEKYEIAALAEIFGSEVAQTENSCASINIQEPITNYQDGVEDCLMYDGFAFDFMRPDLLDDGDSMLSQSDLRVAKNNRFFSYTNDSESVDLEQTIDLIDFTAENDESDNTSMFDFEFEMNGIEPRKALKI